VQRQPQGSLPADPREPGKFVNGGFKEF